MEVNENLKNAFYASVGLALKGKEKVEAAAKEFAEKNKLNAQDGESFIKDITSSFDEKRKDAEDFVKSTVNKVIGELGLVNRKEYESLEKKYEELKAKVEKE